MIDGVSLEANDCATVCLIHTFSDELKEEIRNRLSTICHGPDAVSQESIVASYKQTLKEFNKRYSGKTEKHKKGMIGELLTHVLILKAYPNFQIASPFFNMEEGGVKKGFDLVIFDEETNQLWITEVKSGGAGRKTSDQSNSVLLNRAKNDLKTRLSENETNLWYNAINGAKLALVQGKIKERIGEILEWCYQEADEEEQSSETKNVILVSVLYRRTSEKITLEKAREKQKEFSEEAAFKEVVVFSIQKETYQLVAEYLKLEAAQ